MNRFLSIWMTWQELRHRLVEKVLAVLILVNAVSNAVLAGSGVVEQPFVNRQERRSVELSRLVNNWLLQWEFTNQPAGVRALQRTMPAGINSALLSTSAILMNSNLLIAADCSQKRNQHAEFAQQLSIARQQRAHKNTTQASRMYVALIEGKAPDEFKRTAVLELALLNQEVNQPARALQVFAQYLKCWPEDAATAEIMLRQGLLYRQMGVPTLALTKFYSAMTCALGVKSGDLDYYRRIVLHAQSEIADTYYFQGKFEEAAEFMALLLKQPAGELNRARIEYKLLGSLARIGRYDEVIIRALDFLRSHPQAEEQAEVRFLLSAALQQQGRDKEALQQVLELLKSQAASANTNPTNWTYWQQRAGNTLANQLYLQGDFLSALEIYQALVSLSPSPAWQFPVLYQVGLVYERLQQPDKATETYVRIVGREKELASAASPGLKTLVDMAKWRMDFIHWQTRAERTSYTNLQAIAVSPMSAGQ